MKRTVILLVTALLCSCSKPESVKGVKAARGYVESTVSSVNSGTVRPERVSELAFGAVGRVQHLSVKLGDSVQKDQVLAELENQDIKVLLANAEREARRQQTLLATRNTSQLAFETAQSNLEAAKILLAKTYIKAPFSGVVSELNLEIGQLSQITTEFKRALMRVVDIEPRYVRCEIDEVDYARVKVGMEARVTILAERRKPFSAVVRKVVPFVSSVREQDRTTEIELTVESEGRLLIAGASADVEVISDRRDNVIALPARAILGRGEAKYVFMAVNDKVKKQPVTVGLSNYDRAEILAGIAETDVVIVPTDKSDLIEDQKISVLVEEWL